MDSVMDQVRSKCGAQLKAYEGCVDANSEKWETSCALLKSNLSRCASANVDILQSAMVQCEGPVKAYNTCLEQNARAPYKCETHLQALADCTDDMAKRTR
eukprot:Partr_v1_DN47646_c0_g1_i1_m15068